MSEKTINKDIEKINQISIGDLEIDNSSDSSENEETEFNNIKSLDTDTPLIIKGMTMEQLLDVQEKYGTKAFSKKICQIKGITENNSQTNFKRANKNRPRELPLIRKAMPRMKAFEIKTDKLSKQEIKRDPRFDDLSGKLDIIAWKNNYAFLSKQRKHEKSILKGALRKTKNPEQIKNIKKTIQRMENQETENKKLETQQQFKRKLREEAISSLKAGIAPKFMSRKEKTLTLKAAYFDKLKKENKVDKYLARKEKKIRSKELR